MVHDREKISIVLVIHSVDLLQRLVRNAHLTESLWELYRTGFTIALPIHSLEGISMGVLSHLLFAHLITPIQSLDGSYKGWCAMRTLQNLCGNSIALAIRSLDPMPKSSKAYRLESPEL